MRGEEERGGRGGEGRGEEERGGRGGEVRGEEHSISHLGGTLKVNHSSFKEISLSEISSRYHLIL